MPKLRKYTHLGVSLHSPLLRQPILQRNVLRELAPRAKVESATDLSIYRVRLTSGFIIRGRA